MNKKKRDFNLFCDNCIYRHKWNCRKYNFEFEEGLITKNRVTYSSKCSLWNSVDKKVFGNLDRRLKWTTLGVVKIIYNKRKYNSRLYSAKKNSIHFNLKQLIARLIELGYDSLYMEWAATGYRTEERPIIKKIKKEMPWAIDNITLLKSGYRKNALDEREIQTSVLAPISDVVATKEDDDEDWDW